MEKVTKAGINEAARLKRIIAHMQAEKKSLQQMLEHVSEERDGVMNEMVMMYYFSLFSINYY